MIGKLCIPASTAPVVVDVRQLVRVLVRHEHLTNSESSPTLMVVRELTLIWVLISPDIPQ